MRNLVIVIPPLDEQSKTADYLDKKCAKIDHLLAEKREQLDALESYRKSLIFEVVTGKREVPAHE